MYNINNIDREVELFIFDIYIAILKINKVALKFENVQDLLHSFTDWDSVIREFEIIGEASKYLLRDKLLNKQYQEIVDFRNQITHEYFGINRDIIWFTIHHDLKDFTGVVLKLIVAIDPKLKEELIDSFIEDHKYLDFVVDTLKELK